MLPSGAADATRWRADDGKTQQARAITREQVRTPPQLKLCLGKQRLFLDKPLLPGSFAAWVRTFSQKSYCFEQATCPEQLRCLGQNLFSKIRLFFEQTTCPRQLRCLGQNFFSKYDFFEQATCPGQLRCLGQNFFLKI